MKSAILLTILVVGHHPNSAHRPNPYPRLHGTRYATYRRHPSACPSLLCLASGSCVTLQEITSVSQEPPSTMVGKVTGTSAFAAAVLAVELPACSVRMKLESNLLTGRQHSSLA